MEVVLPAQRAGVGRSPLARGWHVIQETNLELGLYVLYPDDRVDRCTIYYLAPQVVQ